VQTLHNYGLSAAPALLMRSALYALTVRHFRVSCIGVGGPLSVRPAARQWPLCGKRSLSSQAPASERDIPLPRLNDVAERHRQRLPGRCKGSAMTLTYRILRLDPRPLLRWLTHGDQTVVAFVGLS
jgi:hypothetical protein